MIHYNPLPSYLTIKKSSVHGLGVFATKRILKGQFIGTTHYISNKGSLLRTPLGGFYNHSETPNVTARLAPSSYKQHGMRFIDMKAAKDISAGEELTANYQVTVEDLKEIMSDTQLTVAGILQ
tara:strand:+ start:176 stop:544 length:369 start_codon:yes stop_codon:yes gene_type:complete